MRFQSEMSFPFFIKQENVQIGDQNVFDAKLIVRWGYPGGH